MRELAILTFITLDGVMQAPKLPEEDRSGGFRHGGWAEGCWDEVMQQVGEHAMAAPYDMLFGRKTYELFASHWPNAPKDDPGAQRMNAAKKYVVTSTLRDLSWHNSHAVTGDLASEVGRLKREDGPLLQVHGSWQLVQGLLASRLVDELRLWTFPVLVGAGKRLFGPETASAPLTLVKSERTPSGAMMGIYRVSG